MSQFSIDTLTFAKLGNANFRSELHGDAHVPAVDLTFTINAPNTVLAKFDPELLPALYKNMAGDAGQAAIDGVDQVLPNFRFPNLGLPLKWAGKLKGWYLTIDYGTGGDSNIELDLCNVSNFEFSPKEGGTVELKFRVQCASERLTEAVRGKLTGLIQSEVQILLKAPEVEPDDDEDTDDTPQGNPLPFDADPDKAQADPLTPEQALIDSVGDQA